jgi:hypothetical protein
MALSGFEIAIVVVVLAVALWLGLASILFNIVALLVNGFAALVGNTREVDIVKGSDGKRHARRVEGAE